MIKAVTQFKILGSVFICNLEFFSFGSLACVVVCRLAKRLKKQADRVEKVKTPQKKLDSDGEDMSEESSMEGKTTEPLLQITHTSCVL